MERNLMKESIAKDLLKIGAVFLRPNDPFTWASGIKSPIYCDNRLTLSYVDVRDNIEMSMAALIKEKFPDCEALFGTSTAGIAHAAIVAHLLCMPMGYVRSESKDHGRRSKIEGKVSRGQKVIVIEDLISTASSAIDVVNTLREEGADVLAIVSIFTYDMKAALDRLSDADIENHSLTDLDALLKVASENGYIEPGDVERIKAFRDDPSDGSWIK